MKTMMETSTDMCSSPATATIDCKSMIAPPPHSFGAPTFGDSDMQTDYAPMAVNTDLGLNHYPHHHNQVSSAHIDARYGPPPAYDSAMLPTSNDMCTPPATAATTITNYSPITAPPPTSFGAPTSFGDSDMQAEYPQQPFDDGEPSSSVPDTDITIRAFIELLSDEDTIVARDCSVVTIEWSMQQGAREAIASSPLFVDTLLRCLSRSEFEPTLVHCVSGVLFNISQTPNGRRAILRADGVPQLINTLQSSSESAVVFAITSLHNLLLQLDEAKVQIKNFQGLRPIVNLLRRPNACNNPRFFAIVADCLSHLAYKDAESQLIIHQTNGSALLLNALEMCLNDPEANLHPITILSRALKVLSSCRNNKEQIVSHRGMVIIARCLDLHDPEVEKISMWTLRNLSDAATKLKDLNDLLSRLLELMRTQHGAQPGRETVIECALGILCNLTCNNDDNRKFVAQLHGPYILIQTIKMWKESVGIVELAVDTLRRLTTKCSDSTRQTLLSGDGIATLRALLFQLKERMAPENLLRRSERIQMQTCALLKELCALIKNLVQTKPAESEDLYTLVNFELVDLYRSVEPVAERPDLLIDARRYIHDFMADVHSIKNFQRNNTRSFY